jgi:predicted Zn-dependent protease
VADAAAELAAGVGDLDRLEQRLRAGAWGVFPRDALTLAMASRLQRQRYTESAGRATWTDALAACGDSPVGLRALVRLAAAWGDADGTERALVQVVDRQPKSYWAYPALRDIYASQGDLTKLWQLHERWSRQRPDDAGIATTWIVLSCVTNHCTADVVAKAEEWHARLPVSEPATVALAAARWRQSRPREALALLTALSSDAPKRPAVALWIGLAAADVGDRTLAKSALAAAIRSRLSAEEAALVRSAAIKARIDLSDAQ